MSIRIATLAGVGSIGLGVLSAFSAEAAVISSTVDQTLTTAPIAVSFDGVGSFLFTTVITGYGPGAWVATSGSAAKVTTLFGSVTDFEANAAIDQTGELYTFASYPAAQMIPFSAADDFIGLALTLSDGVHYGYAEVDGPELVSVGFQSTAGTSILAGASGSSAAGISVGPVTSTPTPTPTATSTPEPGSVALLATGLAMLGTIVGLGKRIG